MRGDGDVDRLSVQREHVKSASAVTLGPITSERDGLNVSIQIAGSSDSSSTAADTEAGRSVSAAIAAAVEAFPTDFDDSPEQQALKTRTSAVQAAQKECRINER